MKKALFTLLLLPLVSFTSFDSDFDFVGVWFSKTKVISHLTFFENGSASLALGKRHYGNRTADVSSQESSAQYVVMNNKNPYEVDLLIRMDNENVRLKLLCEVIGKNKMKVAMDFKSEERPKEFTPENTSIYTRSK